MELQDRVAIVTGGAVRIGRALSLALAAEGMQICVHYGSSAAAAEETRREIESAGGRASTIQADLAVPVDAADTIIDAALQVFGRVDVLINNAAIFEAETLSGLSADRWRRHQSINLAAPAMLCQRFAAAVARGENATGAIINIVDWRGLRPQPGHLSYTISKAGLVSLTQILAQELGGSIRVNGIAPGAILPPPGADDEHDRRIARVIPVGQTGGTQDITSAALFLLRSDFVNGEILHVTGGQQLTVQMPEGD